MQMSGIQITLPSNSSLVTGKDITAGAEGDEESLTLEPNLLFSWLSSLTVGSSPYNGTRQENMALLSNESSFLICFRIIK